jgi:sigma-E factor negative regulatory protein RseA
MNERTGESLSALMDSEANELEIERLLQQVGRDGDIRARWQRFNLVRHSLQGDRLAHAGWDISGRVRADLDGTAKKNPNDNGLRQRLVKPLTSFAVAASVAATVVIGGQHLARLGDADPYDPEQIVGRLPGPIGIVNIPGARPVPASYGQDPLPALQPAINQAYNELAQRRLHRYMQEHAEQAALNSPQGLLPFARVPEIRE